MPRKQRHSRRLATAARWPVGVALTSWRYVWRTTPVHRLEQRGAAERDGCPEPPAGIAREDLQPVEDGAGPLYHRRYTIRVTEPAKRPHELIEALTTDLNRAAPSEFARFEKVEGAEGRLDVGDEYVVRMPGPWDGPVAVLEATPTSFRLGTLDGHLEAGQIEFSAFADGADLAIRIESWARSGDRFSELLYDRLRMSKEVQLHMWGSFLERAAKLAGGRRRGPLEIETLRVE